VIVVVVVAAAAEETDSYYCSKVEEVEDRIEVVVDE
jgi:hypothetical protein